MSEPIPSHAHSQRLVARAREGDREAFDELVSRYEDRIRGLIRSRVGERLQKKMDIADIQQETLLRAFASMEKFEWLGEDALFRWLSRIVSNVILEAARRDKRELIVPIEDDVAEDDVSQTRAARRAERFDRLRSALDSLKEDYRRVILLARIRRLPMKEVAREMQISQGAATQLLRRALLKMREVFPPTESLHLPDRSLLDPSETASPDA